MRYGFVGAYLFAILWVYRRHTTRDLQPYVYLQCTLTIIGGLGNGPFTIGSGNFVTREITITGVSSRQANDVDEVFQMARLGRIELKNLITKSYRYDQINEALADLEHGKLRMAVSLWN